MIIQPASGYIGHVNNPKSGSQAAEKRTSEFLEYLKQAKFEVRTTDTRSVEHSVELTRSLVNDPECALILAAGGDGTIRVILDTVSRMEISQKVMLLPCGTMNLLARELGYKITVPDLIDVFRHGVIHDLDMGRIGEIGFACVAGFGIDGQVVRLSDEQRKGHITGMHYFWPIWRSFWSHKFPAMRVTADSEVIFEGSGQILVGNISRYGVAFEILDSADYSDGKLDVCIFKSKNRWKLALLAVLTLIKLHRKSHDVIYKKSRNVRIEALEGPVYSEIDGDPGPEPPLDIQVHPAAVKVIGPRHKRLEGLAAQMLSQLDNIG